MLLSVGIRYLAEWYILILDIYLTMVLGMADNIFTDCGKNSIRYQECTRDLDSAVSIFTHQEGRQRSATQE